MSMRNGSAGVWVGLYVIISPGEVEDVGKEGEISELLRANARYNRYSTMLLRAIIMQYDFRTVACRYTIVRI